MAIRKPDNDELRARRRAQKATAARVKAGRSKGGTYEKILPRSFRAPSIAAQTQYARDVQSGRIDRPEKDTPEGKQLARMASLARWNKADPSFLNAFKDYWYHDEAHAVYVEMDEEEAALWTLI